VYTPQPGPLATELQRNGIRVFCRARAIGSGFDVIHGHHDTPTMDALRAAAGVPALFVVHDERAPMDDPPRHPRLRRYVAVGRNTRERLEAAGIDDAACSIIGNGVDLSRFAARTEPLPARPRRALVFSNYAHAGTHLPVLQRACDAEGVAVDVMGHAAGASCEAPEQELAKYDIVFAKGRAATEASAVGAAVVVCDAWGLGPMVTGDNVQEVRRWNFGMRLMTDPLDVDGVRRRIAGYEPAAARAASLWIRQHADLERTVDALISLYRDVVRDKASSVDVAAENDAWRAHLARTRGRRLRAALLRSPMLGPALSAAARALGVVQITALPASRGVVSASSRRAAPERMRRS